jgi:hypothetical protein
MYPSDNGYPNQGVSSCGQSICFSYTRLESGFPVTVFSSCVQQWNRHYEAVDKTYVSLTQGSSQDFLQPCNNEKTL